MTVNSKEVSADPRHALEMQFSFAGQRSSTVWLDNPFNLYLIDRQAEVYLGLMQSPSYGEGFHATIRKLIEQNSAPIVSSLAAPLDVVDLGPGYPDKTFPLLDRMRAEHLAGCYVPVDINRRFLRLAADACRPFGFPIEPRHLLFEELPKSLSRTSASSGRLLLMGVTFMNYAPGRACHLLSKLIQRGDAAVIAVELLRDGAIESMMGPYRSDQAEAFNFLPLEIVGIPRGSVEYFVRFERCRIEMGFAVQRWVDTGRVHLRPGQQIVTSFSYRYHIQDLRALLEHHFFRVEIYSDLEGSCAVARVSV
jgi:uncharacterized SAM-dependent methyltransferase